MKKSLFILSLALLSCQTGDLKPSEVNVPQAQSLTVLPLQKQVPAKSYPAKTKSNASGSVRLHGERLTLRLDLYPKTNHAPSGFKTQLLELGIASKLSATVTDSHDKTYTANGADGNGSVNYTGGTITLTFDNVVPDPLLFIEVQAKNGVTNIVQADLASVIKHTATTDVTTTLNFQTSVAAKAMKALNTANATRARAIDLAALNTKTAEITGVTGTAPNFTYTTHPSLVNTALLATNLVGNEPATLTASDYRQNGATVNLNVSGLNGADKLQVQITDAASAIRTNLGNGAVSVNGVTPGSNIKVLVSAFGAPGQTYTYTANPATLSPTEGASATVNITAAPDVVINSFTPTAGSATTSVTLNGTGFTGATDVRFNGVSAPFAVNSNTQITAAVPAGSTDGPITVIKNGIITSNTNFDVYRSIHVNHSASGANNGLSWANAYTTVQAALTAASANDEIWIAAGTYKPLSNAPNTAFQLKSDVSLYGGFAGTESTRAARDFKANVVVLSGDFSGNDNYGTTPATNITDNAQHVLGAANNAVLDGVMVQGGNGFTAGGAGAGVLLGSGLLTFKNVVFDHNHAGLRGGAIYAQTSAANLSLENVVFSHNSSVIGAVMIENNAILSLAKNLVFDSNVGTGSFGSALTLETLANNTTLENIVFTNNTGGSNVMRANIYNVASNPVTLTINNMLIANNTSTDSPFNALGDPYGNFNGNNITLANNQCGGACTSHIEPNVANITNNILLWKDALTNNGTANDTVDLGSGGTPFLNFNDPDGADNTFFTADDGYNPVASNAGVDAGNTNAGVPTTDITVRPRVGNTDVGAYEYTP